MATISARAALQLRRSSGFVGRAEVWRRQCRLDGCPLLRKGCWSVAQGQQSRDLHTAIVAPGVGDALAALPGAGKDNRGNVTVPIPDKRLARLAELERTKAVAALVTAVDVHKDLANELHDAVCASLNGEKSVPELSGKLLSEVRAADALALAVPCNAPNIDPVAYLHATEKLMIEADLLALAQQTCKPGDSGPTAEWDVAKLRKALSTSKNSTVKRNADALVKEHLVPGFEAIRTLLRSGKPARLARAGLSESNTTQPMFEDLARGWVNALVTWKPLCIFADVEATEAAHSAAGNAASAKLHAYAKEAGLPCIALCTTLEGEVASLREEADFLAEYLASFGLREAAGGAEGSDGLKAWTSQAAVVAQQLPALLNLMTFYTAGEKEARAWQCPRVDREGLPKPYMLHGPSASSQGKAAASGKAGKGKDSAADQNGIPVPYAASAIHTSFFDKVKGVEVWSYDDLDALGVTDSGPAAKDRARSAGKVRKLQVGAFVQEGDVVEFLLPS